MNGRSNESGHVCLLIVTPGLHPLNQCLTNSSPSQGFTNFPLLPNKCCEETVDLDLISNASNIFKYPFKQHRSFTPRQLVKQITMYGMRRENTVSQRQSLAKKCFDPMSNDKVGGIEIKTNPKAGSMGLSIAQTVGHPSFKATIFWFQKMGKLC